MQLTAIEPSTSVTPARLRVALAGNPNVGKTSLFNALTGAHQHVGNYPGVTVERRVGRYRFRALDVELVDLPGTYNLTAWSPEERVARNELLDGAPDVVVVVADANQLKRSLVLLAQVMQLGANVVLALNMSDEAQAAGQELDLPLLRDLLGFPVVETVGTGRAGVGELREAIDRAAAHPTRGERLVLGGRLEEAIATLVEDLRTLPEPVAGLRWIATRLLARDEAIAARIGRLGPSGEAVLLQAQGLSEELERHTGSDIDMLVTERYFGFVDGLLEEVTRRRPRSEARALSDRLDRVLVHRVLGLPFFLLAMYGIFWLTFSLGDFPMGWIEGGVEWLGGMVLRAWPAESLAPLRSLVVDGIIAGVGGVVVFLPNILLLFLGLALLEDTGYMARAAFLMDRFMHRFGLHGKSFLPMVTGFGCSIPGIMGTRILENERDRLTTMLVLPLVPCGARLPIWILLIPAFLPAGWRAPMLWFIYFFGVFLALVLALFLRRTLLRSEEAPFVMELPPYRLPAWQGVVRKMTERSLLYLRKAGTVILGISVVMWVLTSYPRATEYEVDREVAAGAALSPEEVAGRRAAEDLYASAAGHVGRALEPLVAPLGFDWRLATAMVGAFAAKEVFVTQMGIVYSLESADEESSPLRDRLRRDYSPVTGVSLMLFLLIATPCMATLAVTRRESGSWRWALLQFGGLTAVAWVLSFVVYQAGRFIL
jgi:ferrous iron transport protein B